MEICEITNKAKELQKKGITIEELKELFEEGSDIKNSVQYNSALEYIKRKIIMQFSLEMLEGVNGISQYDIMVHDNEDAYKTARKNTNNIYNIINDPKKILKFDTKAIQVLFGNELQIQSQDDVETFKSLLYKKNGNKNQITVQDIYYEEDFKKKYEESRNPIYKIINYFKYRNLMNSRQIESKQHQIARNYIRRSLEESKEKNPNFGTITTETRRYIEKGISQYESNKELLGISAGVITSLTISGEKIDIRDVATQIRMQMNRIQPDKINTEYRDNNDIQMGDENFREEVFKPIDFREIEERMEKFQKEYEELFNDKEISDEDYLRGVARIYANIIYTQPYNDGNKRTAMGILNAMIISKRIIPPYLTTVQGGDFSKGIANTKNNEYELLEDTIVKSYREINTIYNSNKIQIDNNIKQRDVRETNEEQK